jgi:prepilin-type N-terminal cleavage/methylation domain-containing protein
MKRRSLQEDGFTLIEMMVTIAVMIVVMFALYSVFDMTVRVFMFANDKVEAVENARLGLERMEREIRAAYPYDKPSGDEQLFDGVGTTRITFGNDRGIGDRYIDQATEEIAYGLSATGPPYTLQRAVGSGTPQPVVEYIGEFDDGTPGLRFVVPEEERHRPRGYERRTRDRGGEDHDRRGQGRASAGDHHRRGPEEPGLTACSGG